MSHFSGVRPLGRGVWLAIAGLGVTQIIGWGSTYYLLTLLARPIGVSLGMSLELVSAGMSLLLLLSALLGPYAGRLMDMHGARPVMMTGSATAALGLAVLSQITASAGYFSAWLILGVAASMILYPAAFTALTQIVPDQARRAITLLTLPGGLASTVFWPLTNVLLEVTDWRSIALIYAGLNLCVCLPIHALVIPPGGAKLRPETQAAAGPEGLPAEARRKAFILFAAMLALNSLLVTGILNQFMTFMTGLGHTTDVAVLCGMLFGISQVTSRIVEITFGSRYDALYSGVFVSLCFPLAFLLLGLGGTLPVAGIAFAMIFGACNGLLTIVRGALVLSLFGISGYGEKLGKVIVAQGMMGAMAPVLMASMIGAFGAHGALLACLVLALAALVAMTLLFRHAARSRRA